MTNIKIIKMLCSILDKKLPKQEFNYSELIRFVKDRPVMIKDIQ